MIDLHNHILPGLDDGAENLDDSVAIARQFASEGVVRIAATPHVDPLTGSGPTRDEVHGHVERVQAAISAAGIDLEVLAGAELFLTPEADEMVRSGRASTLNGGRYLLVEVSLQSVERPIYLDDTIFRLQLAGIRPILAHPERYPFVQRDTASLDTLIDRDVDLQLTAASFLGEYGPSVRRAAQRLLERGAYTLAASDRHRAGQSRSLATMSGRLASEYDPELAELLLTTNPRRVLASERTIRPDIPEAPPPGWRRVFGRRG